MKLDQATIAQLAEHLENAELQAHDVVKITDAHPEMDWDDAYAIQAEILRRKLARETSVCKFNIGTELRMAFGRALRDSLAADPERFDRIQILRDTIGPVSEAARMAISNLGPG